MIVNNFKKITIGEKGVILKYKSKEQKEIPFSEINKIYHCCPIKLNKKEAIKMASQLKS
jgi:hypothetical protein